MNSYVKRFFITNILPQIHSFDMEDIKDSRERVIGRKVTLYLDLTAEQQWSEFQRRYYQEKIKICGT